MPARWNRPPKVNANANANAAAYAAAAAAGPPPASIDPYARWAQRTGWRCYQRRPDGAAAALPPRVRILAQARDQAAFAAVLKDRRFDIPALYRGNPLLQAADPALPRYFTASLPPERLDELTAHHGLRWELAVPLREAQTALQANPLGLEGEAPRSWESRARTELPPAPARPPRTAAPVPGAPGRDVIAVVDFGAPYLHQNYCDAAGVPRLRAVWDQEPRVPSSQPSWWRDRARAGYGRELSGAALRRMLEASRGDGHAPGLDETRVYRSQNYLVAFHDPRRRNYATMHGAHVLDLAGGRHDPLARLRPLGSAASAEDPDAAGRADLVFVQLPALTAADSSGSSLGAQLLDAVHYVLRECAADDRIVVNISYGNAAGAHDGSSLIEQALDQLLELRARDFAIVLAAGNSGNTDGHTRRLVQPDHSARLRVAIEPEDSTDTFVEVWYEAPPPARQVRLEARVRTPQRDWSDWVPPGETMELREVDDTRPVALLQHLPDSIGSRTRATVLLALAPTTCAVDDDGPLAETGVWEIELRLAPEVAGAALPAGLVVPIEAWIERDDPGDPGIGAQPRFVEVNEGDQRNTLSSLANGAHTVVVGGYRLDDGLTVDYSSLPTPGRRRALPFVLGPCEEDPQQSGLLAAAVRSADTFRMNGTSVAAPVVARQLCNLMASLALGGQHVERADWPQALQALAGDAATLVRLERG